MKYKFLLLVLLSMSGVAAAQAITAPGTTVIRTNEKTWAYMTPVCQFGLQFILVTQDKRDSGGASAGVVLTQVMAPAKIGMPPQPMACSDTPTTTVPLAQPSK